MIIYHGITLVLLSVLVLIVGMIKPKWILFWMDNPARMIVLGVSMAMFMGGAVLFGKGSKEKKEAQEKEAARTALYKTVSDTPAPEQPKAKLNPKPASPTPPSSAPAQAPDTATNELRPD